MSGAAVARGMSRGRLLLWSAIAAGILLVVGANVHMLYVALTSQPDCVTHRKLGSGDGQAYSAAQSACAPQAE